MRRAMWLCNAINSIHLALVRAPLAVLAIEKASYTTM
jgi:hypothetical protein